MNNLKKYTVPILLFLVSILVVAVFLVTANRRHLSDTENVLFQIFSLSAGIVSSYLFGRMSAKDTALEIIKPHSRSAFRRLVSLYKSMGRLIRVLRERKAQDTSKNPEATLDLVEAIVVEQISYADDAMEDWRDVVPEEVDELLKRLKSKESL